MFSKCNGNVIRFIVKYMTIFVYLIIILLHKDLKKTLKCFLYFTKYLKSRMWELKPRGGGDIVLAAYLWSYKYIQCAKLKF